MLLKRNILKTLSVCWIDTRFNIQVSLNNYKENSASLMTPVDFKVIGSKFKGHTIWNLEDFDCSISGKPLLNI